MLKYTRESSMFEIIEPVEVKTHKNWMPVDFTRTSFGCCVLLLILAIIGAMVFFSGHLEDVWHCRSFSSDDTRNCD